MQARLRITDDSAVIFDTLAAFTCAPAHVSPIWAARCSPVLYVFGYVLVILYHRVHAMGRHGGPRRFSEDGAAAANEQELRLAIGILYKGLSYRAAAAAQPEASHSGHTIKCWRQHT